jgi:hypothetical protein
VEGNEGKPGMRYTVTSISGGHIFGTALEDGSNQMLNGRLVAVEQDDGTLNLVVEPMTKKGNS